MLTPEKSQKVPYFIKNFLELSEKFAHKYAIIRALQPESCSKFNVSKKNNKILKNLLH